MHTPTQPADTVVILGCRLVDGVPGAALAARLAAALPLIGRQTCVVVSGSGEAPAMGRWLRDHGVDPQQIIEEPNATSTNENLEFTRALLGCCNKWTVVTSDFHVPRVKMWAWHHGYDVQLVCAKTPPARIPYLWGREVLALIHSTLRVVWRRLMQQLRGR
ncbi:YdcF family protein [Corynebacterium choanae]|uniref:YdcF family protein n=1 Tax=Corynebacterium choanae TaxID=1862358 RepID=UPI001FECFB00|nr:YdcF family protein [Corynebacterium choanae]